MPGRVEVTDGGSDERLRRLKETKYVADGDVDSGCGVWGS